VFGKALGPDTAGVLPLVAVVWSLCDLLTALLLFVEFYSSGRFTLALIATAYAFGGLLTWSYIASYMAITRSLAGLGEQQVPATLYLAWHALFALVVIAATVYEKDRERILARAVVPRVTLAMGAGVIVAAAGFAAIVRADANALPIFVVHGLFRSPYWGAGVPLVVTLTVVAIAALCIRFRPQHGLMLWIAVALFTSLLDAVLNLVSPIRSSYAWDAGKIVTVATSAIVMIFLLLDVIRMLVQSTRTIELRTSRGASRMRALWQIATTDGLSEADHIQMILETAAANIRSGRDVLGVLGRLDGDTVVIDAIARQVRSSNRDAAAAYAPGERIALDRDLFSVVNERGRTCAWHDDRELAGLICTAAGLRSIIAAPIYIGNQTSFVFFALTDAMSDEPFIESDIAFVDVVASNISHRFHQRTQLERLQFQIEHDSLTGLYNRTQFNRFGRLAAMDGSLFGIITIDLDGFRTINEQAGQMIGDELLLEIASALRAAGKDDVVARLGGDEFAVLLLASGTVETLATRLHAYESVFHRPFHTGDRDGKVFLNVTASIGAAHFGRERLSFEEAVTNAGIALDHSKAAGGNRGTIFGADLEYVALERSLERTEINAALVNDEFVLEYQPTFEMNTRTVVGTEALIRWDHPLRGRLPPAAFLSAVKRANALGAMTAWVIRRVARDLLAEPLPAGMRCYFNVPAQILDSDSFLNTLQQTLEAHPQLAQKLGLEITESEVMDKVERAIETLKVVRRLGLTVAIDDFGTGYSSLSYLKRLPIDVVKLDKSFIDGLPEDQNDTALASMFLALTKQFALVSVGEGIETEQQAAWLNSHGCMIGQGFLCSKPIPYRDLIALIRATAYELPIAAR
jgi:diguanylate cyclase (GGDEF)-like protein